MLEISWAELLPVSWVWLRNNTKGELGSVAFISLICPAQNGAAVLFGGRTGIFFN